MCFDWWHNIFTSWFYVRLAQLIRSTNFETWINSDTPTARPSLSGSPLPRRFHCSVDPCAWWPKSGNGSWSCKAGCGVDDSGSFYLCQQPRCCRNSRNQEPSGQIEPIDSLHPVQRCLHWKIFKYSQVERLNLGLVMSDAQCLQDPRIGLAKSFGFSLMLSLLAINKSFVYLLLIICPTFSTPVMSLFICSVLFGAPGLDSSISPSTSRGSCKPCILPGLETREFMGWCPHSRCLWWKLFEI